MCSDGLSGMIKAEDIRTVLVSTSDPLDACKQLTERANQAGGHDNITVIVVRFEGDGLGPTQPTDEPVKYRKYGLPQTLNSNDATARPGGLPSATGTPAAPASEESERESRRLRVGHTMVGMSVPTPSGSHAVIDPATQRSSSGVPRPFPMEDEPVDLPTTGLPPSVMGFIVIGAVLVVVAAGFWLLR